jgi:hypothetical protein
MGLLLVPFAVAHWKVKATSPALASFHVSEQPWTVVPGPICTPVGEELQLAEELK